MSTPAARQSECPGLTFRQVAGVFGCGGGSDGGAAPDLVAAPHNRGHSRNHLRAPPPYAGTAAPPPAPEVTPAAGLSTEPPRGRLRGYPAGPAFEQTSSHWSRSGPIAYVEADFHGGHGYQTAAVWRTGAKVWGPARTWDFTGPREDRPNNAALTLLNVVPSSSEEADYHDLFLEVGLGREQDMDGWQSVRRSWNCSVYLQAH